MCLTNCVCMLFGELTTSYHVVPPLTCTGALCGRGAYSTGAGPANQAGAGEVSDVHDAGIRTICLAVEGPLREDKFQSWLEGILWEGGREDPGGLDVLRAKGLLYIAGCEAGGLLRTSSRPTLNRRNEPALLHEQSP